MTLQPINDKPTHSIFVGYQGIGKSSTAGYITNFIDLESSSFWVENGSGRFRPQGWETIYSSIALHLAAQGFNVFTSSHQKVREELASLSVNYPAVKLYTIAPAPELQSLWLARLKNRLLIEDTVKNKAAYLNAVDRFVDNVNEVSTAPGFKHLIITPNDLISGDFLTLYTFICSHIND